MPGLAEMHGHLPFAGPDDQGVIDLLFLYVANGATLVRGMQGHPDQIRVRAISAGHRFAAVVQRAGFSTQREMALWVALGMSPAEVIHAGTWAVAEHLNELDRAGSVEPGKRADLILLDANPLEDIAAIHQARAGVMVNGQWLSEQDIQTGLAGIAGRNTRP